MKSSNHDHDLPQSTFIAKIPSIQQFPAVRLVSGPRPEEWDVGLEQFLCTKEAISKKTCGRLEIKTRFRIFCSKVEGSTCGKFGNLLLHRWSMFFCQTAGTSTYDLRKHADGTRYPHAFKQNDQMISNADWGFLVILKSAQQTKKRTLPATKATNNKCRKVKYRHRRETSLRTPCTANMSHANSCEV